MEAIEIILTFNKSRSSLFENVLSDCREFADFKEKENEFIVRTNFQEIYYKWDLFQKVYTVLCNWKSFWLKFGGISKNGPVDTYTIFRSLRDIRECMIKRSEAQFPEHYCNESSWSCRMIKSVSINPNEFNGKLWYKFGHFDDGFKIWKVHKDDIKRLLYKETTEKLVCVCPSFNLERFNNTLDGLADEIDLRNSRFFRKTFAPKFSGGIIVDLPVSITHHEENDYDDLYNDDE